MNTWSRVGLMGGTFDPIHHGHMVGAEEARARFELDGVVFIPANVPPHKDGQPITDAELRWRMVLLATNDHPSFTASRMEIDRPGLSYTVDTIRSFREAHPKIDNVFFITGADGILQILTWKDPGALLELCSFIAVTRPGYPLSRLTRETDRLARKYRASILILPIPEVAVSSTEIRGRVGAGQTIRYLVPRAVELFIAKEGLYR